MTSKNLPYDYDALMAKRKQKFVETISHVPSITFYDFIEFDTQIMQAFTNAEPQIIDKRHWNTPNNEVIDWTKQVLAEQNVVGDYLFTFNDYEISWPSPMAKVYLDASYDWVEPLWNAGRGFYFQNMERTKSLGIHMHEGNWEAELREIASPES